MVLIAALREKTRALTLASSVPNFPKTEMSNVDETVLLNIASNLSSVTDFVNFVTCCSQYSTIMVNELHQLRSIFASQFVVTDLMELLFAISHPALDTRLPRFTVPVPKSSCEAAYRDQFVQAWKCSAPVELLLRGTELVGQSRRALPGQFQNIVKQSADNIRDASHLMLHRQDSGNRIYNLVTLLADPDGLHMVMQDDFSTKLDTARRMRAVSEINEAALAHRTIAEIDACLKGELPLKIEIYEYDEERRVFKSVDPLVTARPKLDKSKAQFILHTRFGNEPKEKSLVFEWRPSKGVFRTRRSRSLRTMPYENAKKYSMRLTPAPRQLLH